MGGKKGGDAQVEVTEYYLSMHLGICAEADALTGLYYGEKAIWEGVASSEGAITIKKPDLFGGIKKEGGVGGHAYYLPGGASQVMPSGLAARFGRTSATSPGFRGLASVFFAGQLDTASGGAGSASNGTEMKIIRSIIYLSGMSGAGTIGGSFFPQKGFYWGANSPYLRTLWARVRRAPKGLTAAIAMIPRPGGGGAYRTDTVNLHAVNDAAGSASGGLSTGVTLSGYDPSDVLTITMPPGGTYVAWSPWGEPNIIPGEPQSGSQTHFRVILNGDIGNVVQWNSDGPYDGYEAARAAFPGVAITGGSSYTFYIHDSPTSDNTGGLSLKVDASRTGQDANPAHIIYECLRNVNWGMGAPADIIDTASFEAVAQTLYDEGFGLSMIWTRQAPIENFVSEVLDHIQATLFINPTTGKFTLKLIRDDYDPETLPVLTPDNCRVVSFQRKGFAETINEVIVTWTNPDNEQEETVTVQDLANITVHGPVSDSRNYYGVRHADLAMKLANRDLRHAAAPLATFDLRVNREAWDFVPGGVAKLVYPEYGINGVVLRIGKIDYGKPGAAEISVSAAEDIFGQPLGDYVIPQEGEWADTSQDPTPVEHVRILTTPLYFVQLVLPAADVEQFEYPEVLASVLAGTDNVDCDSYEMVVEVSQASGGDPILTSLGLRQMMGYTTLTEDLPAEAASLIEAFTNLTGQVIPTVSTFLFIGDVDEDEQEIAMVADVDENGFVIQRGLLDTVPRAWPAGTPVWLADETTNFIDDSTRSAGETATYKLLSRTSRGILDLDDAPEESGILGERPWLPNRPADVEVDGVGFGEVDALLLTEVTVTWARRNRLLEPVEALAWTAGDILPEDGQTTTVTLLDEAGAVVTTIDDITGTSQVVDLDLFGDIDFGFIRVTAKRDGLESLQGHEIKIINLGDYLLLSGDEEDQALALSGDEDGNLKLSDTSGGGSPPAPTYVSKGSFSASSTGALPGNPPGYAIDDIWLLFVETANQAVTTPSGWTPVNTPTGTGTAGADGATRLTVFWRRITSLSTPTTTVGDPGDHAAAVILCFRGCKTTGDPWEGLTGDVEASSVTAVSIPGPTTLDANRLIVAAVSNANDLDGQTTPQASGEANASLTALTERADNCGQAGNGGGFVIYTGEKAAAGAVDPTTATLLTATAQERVSLALIPEP